jgi:hypothetical protein
MRPVRILCWSTRAIEPSMRVASWLALISMLKIATGNPLSTATYSAMLSASAVLPIDGRPATTIRSPPCRPEVISSSLV